MRVAWTGASVGDISSGSVAALAGQLLTALLERGVEVDVYSSVSREDLPAALRDHGGLSVVTEPVRWEWNRWYSSNKATALISSLGARALAQVKLSRRLVLNHRRRRYDAIFQFSQAELLLLAPAASVLPPIVVQPSTTASGELYWHRAESGFALRVESRWFHWVVRGFLTLRASLQRVQLRRSRFVVGASQAFVESIQSDYRLPASQTRVLRHPVDLEHYADTPRPPHDGTRPTVLLFASRLSARKGLELVLELSHRLDDLAGQVQIQILGGATMWSDYSSHLSDANPRLVQIRQTRAAAGMRDLYAEADVVLTPSHWEPFSLVTAEALAAGVPVIASDQIGAAEGVDPRVCRTFTAGDVNEFEAAVRGLLADLQAPRASLELADLARQEAAKHFGEDVVGDELVRILQAAAGTRNIV